MQLSITPSETQTMLADSVRRWAAQIDPREANLSGQGWDELVEMGWLMAGIPESAGGFGDTPHGAAVIAEAMGEALGKLPFVDIGVTAARLLVHLSPDELGDAMAGVGCSAFAHAEPGLGVGARAVSCRAEPDGDAWRIRGRKTFVFGHGLIDRLLVSACMPDGEVAVFAIAGSDAAVRAFETIDGRAACVMELDGTKGTLFASGDAVIPAIEDAIDHALVLESAEAVGAMAGSLAMTRDYLMTRKQYGQLIGDFQALRHKLADMFTELEQSRSIVLAAIAALQQEASRPALRRRFALAARLKTGAAGSYVTGEAIQLHGGVGVTEEHAVGHFFKRLLVFNSRWGGQSGLLRDLAELSGETD